MTKKVVNHLIKNDKTVIVGNNEGIEKIAIDTTLEGKGNLVVILNKGINDYLIDSNNQNVLIISEYLNRKESTKETYLFSKRIAVGLSEKVVVIEIEEMDKAIVSVKHALDYSKNILVNPMDLDSKYKGNNKLIKEGADVLVSINDLVDN